eukprot:CAMPEP_0202337334 /NCGR_PEP_ID=MMETSP1126-20121109/50_1 /ASSEMBLY_ACC=CAM_ASM_000457 /TAXON_ID=3047 /ORGANISM="Dunaliella tertiolecta, Strain CCMP1320" /LENGTH=447 /DNA_ID=CAMNT_0048927489 /DNA_START=131 /DNA_END=1471 /DNA_ORIENTATION=+
MGQGQSSGLNIQLEKSTYSPMELVRGAVYFNLSEAVEMDALVLRIAGEERTMWVEEVLGNRNTYAGSNFGRSRMLGAEMCLGGKGTMEPGSYMYPFQFVLPPSLLGSLEWNHRNCEVSAAHMGRALICYYVQAVCVKPSKFSQNIRSEPLPFKLVSACPVPFTGPAEFKDSQTSMVCCCIPKGGISGSLVVPTNVAHAGSEMVIKGHLDNKTSAPIKKVMVNLVQRTTLANDRGYKFSDFVAFLAKVDVNCSQAALQPGSATSLECRLPVPPYIPPSTSGKLIQIDYSVELVGRMGVLTRSFKLKVPILISALPPTGPAVAPPQMPPAPYVKSGDAAPGFDSSSTASSSSSHGTGHDPVQSLGGGALLSKAMDASAAALNVYPPPGVAFAPSAALPGTGEGETQPSYIYPPMKAPPNWCPTIQKAVFLDLRIQRTETSKWDEGDDNW